MIYSLTHTCRSLCSDTVPTNLCVQLQGFWLVKFLQVVWIGPLEFDSAVEPPSVQRSVWECNKAVRHFQKLQQSFETIAERSKTHKRLKRTLF